MSITYLAVKTTAAVERACREIRADIASGRVPASVESFSDLHDYVDANEYGGLCDDDAARSLMPHEEWLQWGNDVQAVLDTWIKDGLHRQPRFTWSGWHEGTDADPEEPGKEWLSIDEEGEEFAIIVLRTGASIFDGKPDDLTAARAAREIRALNTVRALNELDRRGEYA